MLRSFFINRNLKKAFTKAGQSINLNEIVTVGLLVDETTFFKTEGLVRELTFNGILSQNINVIVYKDKPTKEELMHRPVFCKKDFNWRGKVKNELVANFVNKDFDLLISYYDTENKILMTISKQSKAKFKVGFYAVDNRLNNFMIDTRLDNYQVFIKELFKFLKIILIDVVPLK